MIRLTVLTLALVASMGCALPSYQIANPALETEGQIAVRGTQLVAVIRTAQLSVEPLVDARVLTASEALTVMEALGVVLQTCDALVGMLRMADQSRDALARVQALRGASSKMRDAFQVLTTLPGKVSGDSGKMAVSASAGKVVHALADLVPLLGGVQ